ncbi:MAG: VCBS repeat-containing protein [Bacillota bacterium]|nr:VCBS repeat-containing protein [Bacillota bacterium]
MRRLKVNFLVLFLAIAIIITGCGLTGDSLAITAYLPKAIEAPKGIDNDYKVKVLILTGQQGLKNASIYQHFQQSLIPAIELETKKISTQLALKAEDYDLIYLDNGLAEDSTFQPIVEILESYVAEGGHLFLSHEYIDVFPKGFLGIKEVKNIETTAMDFTYPKVRPNLEGLQGIWRSFADDYRHYEGLNPEFHLNYDKAAIADAATPIVEQEGLAYLLANEIGDGVVIWANNFMPNEQFITRLDFIPEGQQKYFHFGYATANYMFRNELVGLVSKEKYGFTLKKSYGPYGRSGVAWQNHYEALYSFVLKDMIKWTDLLAEYNQVPTFSIIRGSYNWGQWHSSLSLQLNIGTAEVPLFPGELENSFYSSGERLESDKDYLTFGRYPGYYTLLADIELPYRSYPQVVDWNGDGNKDLLVGAFDGEVYLVENVGTDGEPRFAEVVNLYTNDQQLLSVGEYSAPLVYDYDGDGLFDLLVGNWLGRVQLYLNKGSKTEPKLTKAGYIAVGNDGRNLKVSGDAAPIIADWDNDGAPDLLVGESTGKVIFFKGTKAGNRLSFDEGVELLETEGPVKVNEFAAPFAVDWNNNGGLDLLVGGGDGEIALYLRDNKGNLSFSGKLEGQNQNFFGTKTINVGHNAVPVVVDWNNNGKQDLLIGQLEYGIPYPIDSELFPYKKELNENISYALKRYLPLIPHLHLHEFKSEELEIREIELHKEAFKNIGIPWEDDMGVNHHTWRVYKDDPTRTFRNLMDAGVWWNFGFNPPNVGTAPKDGKEFLWIMPFVLPDGDGLEPFVLNVSAPNALNFGKAWDSLAMLDVPLTYFEHIEHSLAKDTPVYDKLINIITFMNEFKEQHEYNFMTEEQMARALLNTFFADLDVAIKGDELLLVPNYSNVPDKVKEYANTLGVKVELGEKFMGKEIDSSSMFYYQGATGTYLGVDEAISVKFVDKTKQENKIHLIRSNGPVEIIPSKSSMTIELKTKGMKEFKLYSPVPLNITGKDLKIVNEGNFYTVTHFGDVTKVKVELLKN